MSQTIVANTYLFNLTDYKYKTNDFDSKVVYSNSIFFFAQKNKTLNDTFEPTQPRSYFHHLCKSQYYCTTANLIVLFMAQLSYATRNCYSIYIERQYVRQLTQTNYNLILIETY